MCSHSHSGFYFNVTETNLHFTSYFFKKIVFIYSLETQKERERKRERERDEGRGRSRLHAGNSMWDSIPGLQDHALGRRQTLNHWAIQASQFHQLLKEQETWVNWNHISSSFLRSLTGSPAVYTSLKPGLKRMKKSQVKKELALAWGRRECWGCNT